jgi:hypothetical protein
MYRVCIYHMNWFNLTKICMNLFRMRLGLIDERNRDEGQKDKEKKHEPISKDEKTTQKIVE